MELDVAINVSDLNKLIRLLPKRTGKVKFYEFLN